MVAKKRILIVTEALEMNGVLRSLLDFMEAMDRDQYEIDLFCFDAFKPDFVILPHYVHVLQEDPWCYMAYAPLARIVSWSVRHGAFFPLMRRLVVSAFQKHFPRVFVKRNLARKAQSLRVSYDLAIAYSMGIPWEFVANKVAAKLKLMWLDTDVHFEPWTSFWREYSPYLRFADALVCVSTAIRDTMRREFGTSVRRIETIHNVIDVTAVAAKGNEPLRYPRNEKFRIVTVGRYCEQKNQVMIPKIAEELRKSGFHEFEWIMAGPGSALFKTDDPNLVYLDSLSNPYPLMKSADVYVQPSTYEGWGLTLSEAMCLGRFVIASDIPAFREQVVSPDEGTLVECTPTAFAQAILAARASGCAMTSRRSSVATRFGFDAVRKEFDDLLV